jgi:cob(I)alamin adenosyltransferase
VQVGLGCYQIRIRYRGIAERVKIYTRKGDDGTTGLYYGGRVRKNDPAPAAYGDVDEAQSAIGVARAEARVHGDDELDGLLIAIERDLWVLMADLATDESNRSKLADGVSRVTDAMVEHLEVTIDDLTTRFTLPSEFVVPGQNKISAYLDVARTVVRRAERTSLDAVVADSLVITYLNRLSDLLWTIARWQEHGTSLGARSTEQ